MRARRALLGGLLCALVCTVACRSADRSVASGQPVSAGLPANEFSNLQLTKAKLRASGASDALIDKIGTSPFRYFRAVSEPFKHRTCEAFRDLRWRLPSGAVHGDAHIEQFVVTDEDFGLADFDNAGYGPAIVDLVRYATSLHLACRDIGGTCDPDQAVTAYFNAYRTALDHPVERDEPPVVARLRARLGPEPEAWLQWADGLMQPLAPDEEARVRSGWFRFVAMMRETTPERPESFYTIRRLGSVEIGLGSALAQKWLIRIAGPTDDPRDDVILEARTHSIPEYRGCVWRPTGGSLNVFMLTSLLDHPLPKVFGVLPNPDGPELPELWIQSWERGYRELSLSDLRDQADVNAIAADAGTQLAGHFWSTIPEALRGHHRFTQLRAFELTEHRARDLARSLAGEIVAEWNRYRAEVAPPAR
jgi:Uncharacterized protein conserved in bacteria (DUF2252)